MWTGIFLCQIYILHLHLADAFIQATYNCIYYTNCAIDLLDLQNPCKTSTSGRSYLESM